MTYQIVITEETSANIIIDNNTTNVSVSSTQYPITINYNAVIEQAGGNAYGNSNVAAYLASSSLNGNIITSANISGAYFLGNGSQLTGLPATYGNANVAANLAAFGSNPISTSGNITAGTVSTPTVFSQGLVNQGYDFVQMQYSNAVALPVSPYDIGVGSWFYLDASGAVFESNTTGTVKSVALDNGGNVSATGNITGSYFLGNGSQLTGLPVQPGTYGNANVAANLAAFATNPISTSGNITSGNLNVGVNAVITGNLTVNGTTTTVNSNTVTINDKFINVANNASSAALANGGGLGVGPVGTEYARLEYNSIANIWTTNIGVSVTGNVTGSVFTGNGSGLTALTGANVSGTVANATYALTANASTYAGTVTTAAQPNITSVGILTALNTSGNISATGNITAGYFLGNGSQLTGVIATDSIHATTLRFPVKNTSGGTLAQNTPVYVTGSVGSTETLEVSASRADTAATMPCIGLLETALGVNAFGYAVGIGSLSSTDTSTYTIGQTLYVAATGGLTQTRPTNANVVQSVGAAGRINGSTGQIEVNIWNQNGLPNLGNGNVWIGNAAAYPTQTVLATYSGNIGAGYFSGNGSLLSAITGANVTGTVANATYALNANASTFAGTVTTNAQPNITSVGTLTALTVTGNTQSGNLLTGGLISATGNIIGGNLVIVPGTGAGNIDLVSSQAFTTVTTTNNPARIIFGSGYTGNADSWSVNYDPYSRMRQAGVLVNNRVTRGDGAINTTGLTNIYQQEFTANITTATTRNFAAINFLHVGGGASAFRSTVTSPATFVGQNSFVQAGTNGNVAVGNVVIGSGTGGIFGVQTNSGAQIGNAFGTLSSFQASDTTGNVVNAIGFSSWPVSLSGTLQAPTNFNSFYHPSGSAVYGGLFTNNAFRAATNYYAFKNDDTVAQVQLGSLRSYNEFQYSTATTGTVNIDKTNAQVQFLNPTANVTIGDFQNFVTTANDSVNNDNQTDTVTLII